MKVDEPQVIQRRLERLGELIALLRRDRVDVALLATDADVRDAELLKHLGDP